MINRIKGGLIKLFNYKYFFEILFSVLFLFSYLPHFIYVWMPQILCDSYAYLFIAKDIIEGKLPLEGHRMDVPYGYSLFITFIFKLGGSVRTIIALQTILFFGSFLYLINSIKKIKGQWVLLATFFLWLYASSSQSLLWNTLLYTESIYTSNLVIISGLIIRYFLSRKVKYIYLLSFGVLLGILIRTNGMYLVFIPGLLFIDRFFTRKNGNLHVIFSFVLVLLTSSMLNYIVKGSFLPGESARIVNKLQGKGEYYKYDITSLEGKENKKKWEAVFKPKNQKINHVSPFEQSFKLFTHVSNTKFGNHYYYRMPRQIYNFSKEKLTFLMTSEHEILRYKTTNDSVSDHVDFILQNLSVQDSKIEEMNHVTDIEKKPRNIWLLANHAIELSMPFHRNIIVVLLFYFIFFWNIVRMVRKKLLLFTDESYLITFLSLIHILSLVFLSISVVSNNALPRYAIVSEFIVYIVLALGLLQIFNFVKIKIKVFKKKDMSFD